MMPEEMRAPLKKLLIHHEEEKDLAYIDPVGKITVGIGHNISDNKIAPDIIDRWFNEDVDYLYSRMSHDFKWFDKLDMARKIALIDMAFMGYQKFLGFTNMLIAIDKKDWKTAAFEVINSKYAAQVGNRARDIADILVTGMIKENR